MRNVSLLLKSVYWLFFYVLPPSVHISVQSVLACLFSMAAESVRLQRSYTQQVLVWYGSNKASCLVFGATKEGKEEVRSNRLLFFFSSLFLSQEAGISLPREHWGPFKPVLKGQLNSPLRLSFSPSLFRGKCPLLRQLKAAEKEERGYYFSHHAQSAREDRVGLANVDF